MDPKPPIPDNIGPLAGPPIIGYFLNWGLLGVLSVQIYTYYLAFPKDRPLLKCLAYTTFLIEVAQTLIVTNDAYKSFGPGFGNMNALQAMNLTWLTVPIMSGIVGCTGQLFFAYRIRVFSGSWSIPILVVLASLIGGTAALVAGIQMAIAGDLRKLSGTTLYISTAIWTGGCALCDAIITVSMIYLLSRRDTSFRSTRLVVTRLIRITVETGMATAIVAISHLILYIAFSQYHYFTITALIISKMYSNSMLVIINNRLRIMNGRNTTSFSDSVYSSQFGNSALEWRLAETIRTSQEVGIAASTPGIFQVDSAALGNTQHGHEPESRSDQDPAKVVL